MQYFPRLDAVTNHDHGLAPFDEESLERAAGDDIIFCDKDLYAWTLDSQDSNSRRTPALRRLASLEVNKARAILQVGLWIIGDEHLQLFAGGHQPFLQIENSPAGPQTHHQFLGVERLG